MSSARHRITAGCGLASMLVLGMLSGCGGARSTLELTSHRDPYFPETFVIDWTECAYWVEPSGDIHLAGRAPSSEGEEGELTQYVHVHVYWQPFPGRTHSDASATNALIQYVVANSGGTARYTGTCFAYPRGKPGRTLKVAIESGRLRPDTRGGTIEDFLGSAHVAGTLVAQPNEGAATELIQAMERAAARAE